MEKPKVYIETTIPSYLTAWPSRDLLIAAHQQVTREWWKLHRDDFELFVSALVIEEAGAGDAEAVQHRGWKFSTEYPYSSSLIRY